MENKQYKIALVLKTDGLEYDDRIRKEIVSIQKKDPGFHFTIFPMLPKNEIVEGVSDYGVPFKSVFIDARRKYPSKSKVLLKAFQFWKAVKNDLKEFDVVWTADFETIIITLLVKTKCLIWDLHEFPTGFTDNPIKRMILKYVFNRANVVIHANNMRLECLKALKVIKYPERHFVLSNYPEPSDNSFLSTPLFEKFVKWKGNRKCVYLQGLNDDGRAAYETVAAILNIKDLNAVIVGNYDERSRQRLLSVFSEDILKERVFFVGRIPQNQIANYIRKSELSAVFYKNIGPNNYYCDANRFYLAVSLGLPVVVGNNPSMREIIDKYHFGISIENDGSDIVQIRDGLMEVLNNYSYYKQNVENDREKLLWSSQDNVIEEIIATTKRYV